MKFKRENTVIPAKAGIYLNRFPIKSGMTNVLHVALTAPIKEIDRRIEERVRQRLKGGVENEVRSLVQKYSWDSALSLTIAYKEWRPYIDLNREQKTENKEQRAGNRCSSRGLSPEGKQETMTMKKDVITSWTIHEKQYARRQLTWMAKYSPDKLFDISQSNCILDIEAYVGRWYYGKE